MVKRLQRSGVLLFSWKKSKRRQEMKRTMIVSVVIFLLVVQCLMLPCIDSVCGESYLVRDINDSMNMTSSPGCLTDVSGTLFFKSDDGDGYALWKSDGTPEGTTMVKDINPGEEDGIWDMVVYNELLFFPAVDGVHGRELWSSNGTSNGTVIVNDIRPGQESSDVNNLASTGDLLFFTATTEEYGNELWAFRLDSTKAKERWLLY